MLRQFWMRLCRALFSRPRPVRRKPRQKRVWLNLEPLSDRIAPAVTASFLANAGILTVLGDAQSNNIVVSSDAAGNLLVNGGAVTIQGGPAPVLNTTLIQVFGQGGNDTITLDEANGPLKA